MSISFDSIDVNSSLESEDLTKRWLTDVILQESKMPGDLQFFFCSDDYLLKINQDHLNHDTYTDIITFNYCVENIVHGEIFISTQRVEENAVTFGNSFQNELHRVIVHGILHLLDYDDKDVDQQKEMRAKEDFYLSLREH